jgi:hypothetical protein
MTRVALTTGLSGPRWARLRPLTGEDEMGLEPDEPSACNLLLARLLVASSEAGTDAGAVAGTHGFAALSVADRDRLLAAVYRAQFGDRVEGITRCGACAEGFEFGFSLTELIASLDAGRRIRATGPDPDGYYRLPDGTRFRVPTVCDLEACATVPPGTAARALLERCIADPSRPFRRRAVESAMERIAPVLSVDVQAACPHCGRAQKVAFSLEEFLLRSLARERRFLTHEIHRLASAYGWSLGDILRMSREDRRSLVRRVEAEAGRTVTA